MSKRTHASRIAALNDAFRSTFIGGKVLLSHGISCLAEAERRDILKIVQDFNAFTPDNDPHGEHDFGAFEYNGWRLLFKIEYYEPSLTYGSEDPADPAQTMRVLTILYTDEY